ncbi:MAG: twin-arginine translocase TatA/TatE family subunit, partial [Chloroflexota bacterium]|nr:twin-arginine translocase TatA/TatE family subunit [Dehalococcoidia bacterium]MDW8047742.1 twin-arginine translocase TatA/TatE family subunit [Chloroflexota bacterium]
MFGPIGGPELALIALAIILVFGVGRFSRLGRDLGTSIREFRRAVREDDDEKEK